MNSNKKILVATKCSLVFLPPFRYTCHVQITTEEGCSYRVHVLLHKFESITVIEKTEVCAMLKKFSMFHTRHVQSLSGYTTKNIILRWFISILTMHRTESSFYRMDSVNCKLWFEIQMHYWQTRIVLRLLVQLVRDWFRTWIGSWSALKVKVQQES